MATIVYRNAEGHKTLAVLAQVSKDSIKLQYFGAGTKPGEKINAALKGLKLSEGKERTIELSDLKKRADWGDHSIFAFPTDSFMTVLDPINLFAEASQTKSIQQWLKKSMMDVPFRIFIPFAGANFLESEYGVSLAADGKVVSNLKTQKTTETSFKKVQESFFPKIKLSSAGTTRPEGVINLDIKAESSDGKIYTKPLICYLECTAGYLAKQRIELKDGKATVKFKALLLESGDQAKIKAGFRFFSGASEQLIKVV